MPDLTEEFHRLDEAAFAAVSRMHAPLLDRTLPALSEAANRGKLWIGVGAVLPLVEGRRGVEVAAEALAAGAATSFLANVVAKGLTGRRRPRLPVPEARRLDHPRSSSFPSGHAATAAAVSGVIGAEVPWARPVVTPLAVLVAFSRVYTGVHHPGDVLAGWILGRSVARAVRAVARALR